MAVLETRNLVLSRQGTPVLHNVNLSVETGETLVIIGPSGGGKSSLLRCLNRLEEPPQETVFFHGQDITRLPVTELRRHIGFVFQKTAVFDGTIAENIAFGPALHGKSLSPDRIRELMHMVALPESLYDKSADALSGGQEQRMAIARALANEPEMLLLDEPTSALDPIATKQVEETLLTLRENLGLTLIWVSHVVAQARRVAKRVLLLDEGHVLRVDTVEAMLDPSNGDKRALAFADGSDVGLHEGINEK